MDDMAMRARVARQRTSMPQSQLADRAGVTRSAVANWQISMRKKPNTINPISIVIETGVSLERIATGHGNTVCLIEGVKVH